VIVYCDAYGASRVLPGGETRQEAERRAAQVRRSRPDHTAVRITTATRLIADQRNKERDL
jgi:hypothetical protein